MIWGICRTAARFPWRWMRENDEWIVVHSDSLGTHLGEHLGSRLSVTIDINGEVKQSGTVTIPANPGTESYTEEDYETGEDSSGTPAPAEPSSSGQDVGAARSNPQPATAVMMTVRRIMAIRQHRQGGTIRIREFRYAGRQPGIRGCQQRRAVRL